MKLVLRLSMATPLLTTALLTAALLTAVTSESFADETDGVAPQSRAAAAPDPSSSPITAPSTVDEARGRAQLLYETVHGALQVMHRDFFNEEDAHTIPSASLEDVFEELSKSYGVKVRWLIVDTDIVNVDHKPQDAFEQSAARSLAKGVQRIEATDGDTYRFAGPVRLASQCLKCHVKDRTSTEERTAGLLISMPILKADKADLQLHKPADL